jgi:response regulator RpfG family c-di-GMP phosphodiesterase
MPSGRPRVLCVDDEPAVLEGLGLHLRRGFECVMAGGGEAALAELKRGLPFAVILSDMRMPGMDGATFLARARSLAPDTVRVLLTGQADLDSALAAVNHGQIFRFLTKPCPPDVVRATLDQAAEQHRLVVAERELLEQTLTGAVKALTDLLALASPSAFGRASRLRRTVAALCQALDVQPRWAVEVAAQLSQVGFVALAPAVADKVHLGSALTPSEQSQVDRAPELADQLLAHIPRLEPVREILKAVARRPTGTPRSTAEAESMPIGAQLLSLAAELDALEVGGMLPVEALAVLEQRFLHAPRLVEALRGDVAARTATTVREVMLHEIRPGMVLAADVRSRAGVLLVARGHTVSAGLQAKLMNLNPQVAEPIRVVAASGADAWLDPA